MKVIIDISPLQTAHKTRGIGMYTRHLVEALQAVDKRDQYILTTKKEFIKGADVIHYPYFDLFYHTLPMRKQTATVVTIHDVIPLVFPEQFPVGLRGKVAHLLQRLALRSADAIITDSHHSKEDIVRLLRIDPDRIHVIHLAASQGFKERSRAHQIRVRRRYRLPAKYILYVGDVNPNKNLVRLVDAFAALTGKFTDLHLVMVGRAFADVKLAQVAAVLERIERNALSKKVRILTEVTLDPVDDLAAIYSAAEAYVHPSLYEGFGLPVLEAFACGAVVICSQLSSLPEVAGKAAIVVDPNDSESLARGITQALLLTPSERRARIRLGKQQARRFSWERTASETINVYTSVAGAS